MHKLMEVPIGKIDLSPFNPASRTTRNHMSKLTKDIKEYGVISPIHVIPDGKRFIVADGHRRFTAATAAGLKLIPAVLIENMEPAELYSKQFLSRRLTGNEVVHIYLKEPLAVPEKKRNILDRITKLVGRRKMGEYAKSGASVFSFQILSSVDNYLAKYLPDYAKGQRDTLITIADWLIHSKQQATAKQAVQFELSPTVLWKSAQNDKPLTLEVTQKVEFA